MKQFITRLIFILSFLPAFSQSDTAFSKTMDELVITATRTERKLSNVAVPAQVISSKIIQQSGSARLNEILQEQTGLFITNGSASNAAGGGVFGTGVQIQGLSPDYTMILIDGEPVIGRQGGVIDLSRLVLSNVKKIEIVKGPSSSLYGSEAMGGVVNIITEQPRQNRMSSSFRYGRFNAIDANLDAAIKKQKWGLQLFGNRNSSDGFDLDKTVPGNTIDPFVSYTTQGRFVYQPSAKTKLNLSARYLTQSQKNFYPVTDIGSGKSFNVSGNARTGDIDFCQALLRQFNDNLRSSLRFYFSRYQYEQVLNKETDQSVYYHDFFRQDFFRAENQTDWHWEKSNYLSLGAGIVTELLNTTRYTGKRSNTIQYGFFQNEWRVNEKYTIIGGLRFDNNTAYQSKWSPKLAMQYKLNDKLRINASFGAGFKAPDFRQLFLNFTNMAAGGYVIYGANEATVQLLQKQEQQGLVADILPRAYQLALLKPEVSRGLNMGFHYDVNDKLKISANLFRNDISNLIQVDVIAHRINQAPVYSYFNVSRAYTEGMEWQLQYSISKNLSLQGGYQFLITADKEVLSKIKSGEVYGRTETSNQVYVLGKNDYAGLTDRSRHMANLKFFYDNKKTGWSGSFRAIYRSRWGTEDKDGNNIINRRDEFANGFLLLNVSAAKQINSFVIRAGVDNLLNYKDVLNLPSQPGIQPYVSFIYSFIKNQNQEL